MLTARMKGDGGHKNYVRILFLEISDPKFNFGQLILNKNAIRNIVNASYCSPYVNAFSA